MILTLADLRMLKRRERRAPKNKKPRRFGRRGWGKLKGYLRRRNSSNDAPPNAASANVLGSGTEVTTPPTPK